MPAMTLEALTGQLQAAFGPALRAAVLYGSAVREAEAERTTTYDLLVVVDALPVDALQRVAPTVRAWREAGHPPPLMLTTAEWRSSADVFPMEYAEVLDRHRVLAGELPLEGVTVEPQDLRRQLEFQALGTLLRVRGGVLAAGNHPQRVFELLFASRSTVLVLLRTLARLHGADPMLAPAALVGWAGGVAGFDPGPLVRMLRDAAPAGRAVVRVGPRETEATVAGYLTMLERLVAHVDALRAGPPSGRQ